MLLRLRCAQSLSGPKHDRRHNQEREGNHYIICMEDIVLVVVFFVFCFSRREKNKKNVLFFVAYRIQVPSFVG